MGLQKSLRNSEKGILSPDTLRYSVIIDGRDAVGCARLKDARFHAQTAALDAGCVEIYDSESGGVVETFYAEEE